MKMPGLDCLTYEVKLGLFAVLPLRRRRRRREAMRRTVWTLIAARWKLDIEATRAWCVC